MSSTTTSRRPRNPALVIVDILASLAILGFALVFGLVMLGFVAQLGDFTAGCGTGPYTGLECNSTALAVARYALLTVTVVAFFLGLGMAIVRTIQKRLIVLWPLGALVVMYLAFNLTAWVAGMTVPA